MWIAHKEGLKYREWSNNSLVFPVCTPDWSLFSWELLFPMQLEEHTSWYDAFVQYFPRDKEIDFVKNALLSLQDNPRRMHIRGISCAESMDLLYEYYSLQWYEDKEAKNYIIPEHELFTVSVSLRHILWCEKDKHFLSQRDAEHRPYYSINPPIRSPRDLRVIQQAARRGVVVGIEVIPGDNVYIVQLLEKQILTPFQLTQLIGFSWEKYGFTGSIHDESLFLPDFSEST